MLPPHLSEIHITRREPEQNFDAETASKQVARRFSRIAEQIVQKALLKAPKDPVKTKSVQEKIRSQIETEERFKHIQEFMTLWNRFRDFYFRLDPIQPKNKQQIATIENCIQFAKDKKYNLNILVACIHKMYEKRRIKPNYSSIISYGEEAYENFYESVQSDFDKAEYEYNSAHVKRE